MAEIKRLGRTLSAADNLPTLVGREIQGRLSEVANQLRSASQITHSELSTGRKDEKDAAIAKKRSEVSAATDGRFAEELIKKMQGRTLQEFGDAVALETFHQIIEQVEGAINVPKGVAPAIRIDIDENKAKIFDLLKRQTVATFIVSPDKLNVNQAFTVQTKRESSGTETTSSNLISYNPREVKEGIFTINGETVSDISAVFEAIPDHCKQVFQRITDDITHLAAGLESVKSTLGKIRIKPSRIQSLILELAQATDEPNFSEVVPQVLKTTIEDLQGKTELLNEHGATIKTEIGFNQQIDLEEGQSIRTQPGFSDVFDIDIKTAKQFFQIFLETNSLFPRLKKAIVKDPKKNLFLKSKKEPPSALNVTQRTERKAVINQNTNLEKNRKVAKTFLEENPHIQKLEERFTECVKSIASDTNKKRRKKKLNSFFKLLYIFGIQEEENEKQKEKMITVTEQVISSLSQSNNIQMFFNILEPFANTSPLFAEMAAKTISSTLEKKGMTPEDIEGVKNFSPEQLTRIPAEQQKEILKLQTLSQAITQFESIKEKILTPHATAFQKQLDEIIARVQPFFGDNLTRDPLSIEDPELGKVDEKIGGIVAIDIPGNEYQLYYTGQAEETRRLSVSKQHRTTYSPSIQEIKYLKRKYKSQLDHDMLRKVKINFEDFVYFYLKTALTDPANQHQKDKPGKELALALVKEVLKIPNDIDTH